MAKDSPRYDDDAAPKHTPPPQHGARQSEAPEPTPKTAPLVLQKGPDGRPLEQPPAAPVAGAGPLPRTIDQNERAYEGTTRYKIRADALADVTAAPPTKYILVKEDDEEAAKEHYLRTTGIKARIDNFKAAGLPADKIPTPFLVVRKLAD